MGNLLNALVFVMTLNVLMWLSQVAALDINPQGAVFYNCNGSLMEGFGSKCSDGVVNTDVKAMLPSAQAGNVGVTVGQYFTDIFNSISGWLKSIPGLNYIYEIAAAPYNILKAFNLPNEFVFAIGTFWYGISVFLIVAFMWWRE